MSTVLEKGHKYIIEGDLLRYLYQLRESVSQLQILACLLIAGKIAKYMEAYVPQKFNKD